MNPLVSDNAPAPTPVSPAPTQEAAQRRQEEPKEPEKAPKAPLPKADKYIWAIYIFILAVSVVELYSASSREITGSNVFAPLLRHGKMLLLGVGLTIGFSRLRYKWLIPMAPVLVIFSLVIGVYVFFKGDVINGAMRSTTILGIPVQPSEIMKLAAVVWIALVISLTQIKRGVATKGVVLCAFIVLLFGGLLYRQGLTNTLLLMGTSFALMLIGGVEVKKFLAVLAVYAIVGGGYIAYAKATTPHYSEEEKAHIVATGKNFAGKVTTLPREGTQKSRIARWLDDSIPKYDQTITSENRQEQYSYMAQANGGLHGKLPGNSRETARLPLAFSDYIFAIIVEDWGLLGGIILLGAYLALLLRAGAIASRCSRAFPALLVMGMAMMIVLQALFHMAIVTGVFPVSGQPLPLISKGGSSIIATSIAFGIMLSVSRYAVQSNKKKDINAEILELPPDLSAANPAKLN